MDRIKTYLVHGFLDAGKTTYIQEQVFGGFFHKRGTTLILVFEEGEEEYDIEKLNEYRTEVLVYDGTGDISSFCTEALECFRPDRVYVEMNVMTEDLRDRLPPVLDVVFSVSLIDGNTLPLYFSNMRQLFQNMIQDSHMAIFNRCREKGSLAPYAVPFRIMNRNCDFLWQSEMGYSEKAFGRMLPYDSDAPLLHISEEDYPVFHLDAHENPRNYAGKTVVFDAQIKTVSDPAEGTLYLGRSVMTCCLLDIQFLGFACSTEVMNMPPPGAGSWVRVTAEGYLAEDRYHAPAIGLRIRELQKIRVPEQIVLGIRPAAQDSSRST